MEKLEKYDGFWKDKVSNSSADIKREYLERLIHNQKNNLSRPQLQQEDRNFYKKIIELAQAEKNNLKIK